MACYEPLQAWTVEGVLTDAGKQLISFRSEPYIKPEGFKRIQIPCGRCIGCRLDYSRMWMARITKEAGEYENNMFLTLTYNPEHLPTKDTINKETGELITGHPLVKEHVQKFIKRLRRQYEYHFKHTGIRYYACGEYGGKTHRPHYHLAIFNCDATAWGDIKFLQNNIRGDALWTSQKIEQIWGKGFITIGDLTPQSAAYIARYMLKKQKGHGKEWYYESQGIVSEYNTMSCKPGLSRTWYDREKNKLWESDIIYVPQRDKAPMEVKTPAYFDKLLEVEDPEKYKRIKEARQRKAEMAQRIKQSKTTLPEWEQRKVEKEAKEQAAKKLIRPLE